MITACIISFLAGAFIGITLMALATASKIDSEYAEMDELLRQHDEVFKE